MPERTTIRLPQPLLARAKRKAAAEGRTLTSLIEQGLRLVVAAKNKPRSATLDNPPVSKARGGLLPGLNWENLSASLQEAEDREYAERIQHFE